MPEKADATTAFAARSNDRFGTAMNVVRISPLRYSLVTVSADRIISTGTPKTTAPVAARSGDTAAANPRLRAATAAADHAGERVVDSLMRSAFNTVTAFTSAPGTARRHR